jgi:hypothetical protein
VEELEPRLVLNTYTVVNTDDTGDGADGSGDLRYCIEQANAHPGADRIVFDMWPPNLHTITLESQLPLIEDPWSSPRKVDSKLRVLPFELRRGDIPQR